ncbi:MAG: nitrite reductase small subunit NirD [Burkholderiaceae bacterium]|nr:nitrite reductase small subunit NirD [Burkholderiaceae bacterium]
MNAVGREWIEVCALDDLPALGARVLRRGAAVADIALFRTADGRVHALEDRCPHRGGPLSQGIVAGGRVTCPLHGWTIELDSGAAVAPDVGTTRRFAVRVEQGRVLLEAAAFDLACAAPKPPPCPLSRATGTAHVI